MSRFWKAWLTGWCWAVVAFGAVLTGGAFPATDGLARAMLHLLNPGDPAFDPALRFSLALMGAVTVGWGLTLLVVTRAAHRIGKLADGLWAPLTQSLAVWYVVDSGLSIATGFGLNAVSNTVLTAGFLLPVLRSGLLQRSAP